MKSKSSIAVLFFSILILLPIAVFQWNITIGPNAFLFYLMWFLDLGLIGFFFINKRWFLGLLSLFLGFFGLSTVPKAINFHLKMYQSEMAKALTFARAEIKNYKKDNGKYPENLDWLKAKGWPIELRFHDHYFSKKVDIVDLSPLLFAPPRNHEKEIPISLAVYKRRVIKGKFYKSFGNQVREINYEKLLPRVDKPIETPPVLFYPGEYTYTYKYKINEIRPGYGPQYQYWHEETEGEFVIKQPDDFQENTGRWSYDPKVGHLFINATSSSYSRGTWWQQ